MGELKARAKEVRFGLYAFLIYIIGLKSLRDKAEAPQLALQAEVEQLTKEKTFLAANVTRLEGELKQVSGQFLHTCLPSDDCYIALTA